MVSLIGWIVTTGSCEDSVSKIIDELGLVETTPNNLGICEDDVTPKVQIVLVSVERCRLSRPEMDSCGKAGLIVILRERWGNGCSSSMITD